MTTLKIHLGADVLAARRMLRQVGADMAPSKLLAIVGSRHLRWVNENFRAEGLEHSWERLAMSTIESRRKGRGRGSARILRNTGRLAQSFTMQVRATSVEVGTNIVYAKWHEKGTDPYTIRPKDPSGVLAWGGNPPTRFAKFVNHPGLPARPMLPSKRLAEQLATEALRNYAQAVVAQTTGQGPSRALLNLLRGV